MRVKKRRTRTTILLKVTEDEQRRKFRELAESQYAGTSGIRGIPVEYLLTAQSTALENFELMRLSYAANIRKEIVAMQAEAERAIKEAGVARWLMENREELLRPVGKYLARPDDGK